LPVSAVQTKTAKKVRATVRMPANLYDEARRFVDRDIVPADNINDFFVAAICAYVKLLHRKQIDSEFAKMAVDTDYQKEAKLLDEEFATSDWEAFELAERDPDDDLQAFQAWESYQLAARNLGVTTGLENWQPPQKKA